MTTVIGYFGYLTNQLDGQTVKTRMVHRLLAQHRPDAAFFDTQDFQRSHMTVFAMLWKVLRSKHIIYLPAHNNLKYIFPIIWLLAKASRTKISYLVVGGWLASFIKPLPLHRFMLKRIEGIYTETDILRRDLETLYGFRNVAIMRNFRFIDFQPTAHHTEGRLKLVFMARIMKEKGLAMIFALAAFLKEKGLDQAVSIDFYGQKKPTDEAYFDAEVEKFPNVAYHGALAPEEIHQTLEKYDAMILPTHYPGEGLPGSVIDSYISGLPIIVTVWRYAREFVEDGKTGIIVPYENGQREFNEAVVSLLENPEKLRQMKNAAAAKSAEFSETKAWEIIKQMIGD